MGYQSSKIDENIKSPSSAFQKAVIKKSRFRNYELGSPMSISKTRKTLKLNLRLQPTD